MDFEIIYKFITGGLSHDPAAPTLDKVINNNLIFIIFLVLIVIAIFVGRYALGMKMFGKDKAWKAIIPFYGLMLLFRAVDLNPYLAIAVAVPILGLIPFGIFCFLIPKAFAQKIDMQLLTVFFPYVTFNMLGFDKKYDYQYIKGKNVAFKNEFRTVMPEDLAKDAMTPASAVNGAAVSSIAQESAISRAASAAAEQNRLIIEEQEKAAAAEAAKKKAEEEAKKKETSKVKPEDYKYDIFSSEAERGPESASLNISFNIVNGKFKSAGIAPAKPVVPVTPAPATPVAPAPVAPAPVKPVAPVAPQPQPAPVQAPTVPTPVQGPVAPVTQMPAAPAPVAPAPTPVAPVKPVAPAAPIAPQPQSAPAQPAPVAPVTPIAPTPGIQMTAVPPVK